MLRLTKEREKRNWTKLQLAFKSGIHPVDIGRLESKKIFPYPGWKKKLEKVFDIDGDKLFEEVNNNEK